MNFEFCCRIIEELIIKAAEIKYHNEVLYGLQLDTLELGYYVVQNEYGVKIGNLEKIIDNQEPLDAEIEP